MYCNQFSILIIAICVSCIGDNPQDDKKKEKEITYNIRTLKNSLDSKVRGRAAGVLKAHVDDANVVDCLIKCALSDKSADVRLKAVQSLASTKFYYKVLKLYKRATKDEMPEMQNEIENLVIAAIDNIEQSDNLKGATNTLLDLTYCENNKIADKAIKSACKLIECMNPNSTIDDIDFLCNIIGTNKQADESIKRLLHMGTYSFDMVKLYSRIRDDYYIINGKVIEKSSLFKGDSLWTGKFLEIKKEGSMKIISINGGNEMRVKFEGMHENQKVTVTFKFIGFSTEKYFEGMMLNQQNFDHHFFCLGRVSGSDYVMIPSSSVKRRLGFDDFIKMPIYVPKNKD